MTHKLHFHSFKNSVFIQVGVLVLIGFTVFAVASQFPQGIAPSLAQSDNIPPAANSCIPKAQVARAELVSSTAVQDRTYYLLAAYEQGDSVASDLIISVANRSCRKEFYNPTGDRLALASAVPQPVARQLTLQRYQREIKRIGKQTFEQQVKQSRRDRWFDEEAWALQQLGIRTGKAAQ